MSIVPAIADLCQRVKPSENRALSRIFEPKEQTLARCGLLQIDLLSLPYIIIMIK